MWYHLGYLGTSSLDMGSSYQYDAGWNPSVAIDRDNGTAVEVHNGDSTAGPMWVSVR